MKETKLSKINVTLNVVGNLIGIIIKLSILYCYPIYFYLTTGNVKGALIMAGGIFINLILINIVMVFNLKHPEFLWRYIKTKMRK